MADQQFRVQVQPSWSTKIWANDVGLHPVEGDAIRRATEITTTTGDRTRVVPATPDQEPVRSAVAQAREVRMTKIYGAAYQPLKADVLPNRRKPDQPVAFIDGQLCFFERGATIPAFGSRIEVMITRASFRRYPEGHKNVGVDPNALQALMIDLVDREKHVLVAIDGFECSGSMCRTTARGAVTDGARPLTSADVYPPRGARGPQSMWLTPGRSDIRVAENNSAHFYGREPTPLTPTNVWVERAVLAEKGGCGVRVAGLTRIEDGRWAALVQRTALAA